MTRKGATKKVTTAEDLFLKQVIEGEETKKQREVRGEKIEKLNRDGVKPMSLKDIEEMYARKTSRK